MFVVLIKRLTLQVQKKSAITPSLAAVAIKVSFFCYVQICAASRCSEHKLVSTRYKLINTRYDSNHCKARWAHCWF